MTAATMSVTAVGPEAPPRPDAPAPTPPTLSVIIPVRNGGPSFRRCLDALAALTLRPLEVVVVDDDSTDDTADVAVRAGARVIRLDYRSGPGVARNAGARVARGDVLLFVDADVCVRPDTLQTLADTLLADPRADAVFGAYDVEPAAPNLVSQYKNLSHHFVHRQGRREATTFWAGCGAVRREAFAAVGGFDPRYDRPCIEDIELGTRLFRAGRRIVLEPRMQATHLKRWMLAGLVKCDVADRAVPWTRLILRHRDLPNDLNLGLRHRVSAALALACVGLFVVTAILATPRVLALPALAFGGVVVADAWTDRFRTPKVVRVLAAAVAAVPFVAALAWARVPSIVPLAPVALIVALNAGYYRFFVAQRGPLFAAAVVPLHVLYYLYSVAGLGLGIVLHLWDAARGAGSPPERRGSLAGGSP